jgi:hypothetical protein
MAISVRPCCCGSSCAIRSSGCTFTSVSGTWTNSSGTITTASANAAYKCGQAQPSGTGDGLLITVTMQQGSTGDNLQIILGDPTGGHYDFVEISGTQIRYANTSGTTYETSPYTFTAGTAYTISVCSSTGNCIGSASFTQVKVDGLIVADMHYATNRTGSTYTACGLGTGATVGAAATFTNFSLQIAGGACPDCCTAYVCLTCAGTALTSLNPTLVVGGVGNAAGSPNCAPGECAAKANGTFVLTDPGGYTYASSNPLVLYDPAYSAKSAGMQGAQGTYCQFGYSNNYGYWCRQDGRGDGFGTHLIEYFYDVVFWYFPDIDKTVVQVVFAAGGPSSTAFYNDRIVWSQDYDGHVDCGSFTGQNIPLLQNVGPTGYCDGTGSTATLGF